VFLGIVGRVMAQLEVSPKICTTWSCVYCDPLEVF
jgi:hypothetical protein